MNDSQTANIAVSEYNKPVTPLTKKVLFYFYRLFNHLTQSGQVFGLTANGLGHANRSAPFLILARGCYQETNEISAIASVSELRKVLKQKFMTQFCIHHIGALNNGSRLVKTFTVYPQYSDACQHARFVIPETLALAMTVEPGLFQIRQQTGEYFLFKQNNAQWQSVLKSPIMSGFNTAALSLGVHDSVSQYQLAETVKHKLLIWSVLSQSPAWLIDCWQPFKTNRANVNWRPTLVSLTVMIAVYLGASSYYIAHEIDNRTQIVAQYGDSLEQIAAVRAEMEAREALFQQLNSSMPHAGQIQAFWSLLAFLQLKNINVNNLSMQAAELSLTGVADNASQLLTDILKLEFVEKADFDAPIRKVQQDQERFSLKISLKPDPVLITLASASAAEPELKP
uniref:General secretion pathway protein L n=1 Tax=Rheinheimera sp. BAL341 TaxID=1708203 RepID=A0A486XY17_9GAMM